MKRDRPTRWAICGKCHKFHREGTKVQKEHEKQGYMGKDIRWTTTDPKVTYGTNTVVQQPEPETYTSPSTGYRTVEFLPPHAGTTSG